MSDPSQQPPVPPGGWHPTRKRIPEDQPFIARPNVTKRLPALLVPVLLILALGAPTAVSAGSSGPGQLAGVLALLLGIAVPFVVPLGVMVWLTSSGGPVLAVGPDGLWIKTRPTRGKVIWLPWAAIERIYRRRLALEKVVCVKPRDPRVSGNLGAFTALDSGVQKAQFGTGFIATLKYADRSEQEIMGAIVHFAAGRCPIE